MPYLQSHSLAIAVAAIAVLTTGVFLRAESSMSQLNMETICLGRLTLALPENRALTDTNGKLDDVLVEALPPVDNTERAIRSEKSALMQAAGATENLVTDERRADEIWLASYRLNPMMDEPSAVRALRFDSNALLRLNSVGESTYIKEIADAVAKVARALEPVPDDGLPAPGSFCFANGYAAVVPYGGYTENVNASFTLEGIGKLSIQTHTNGDNPEPTLQQIVSKGSDDMRKAFGEAPSVVTLPEARNSALESDAAMISDGKPSRLLLWRAPGKPQAPYDPFVELRLRTSEPAGAPEEAFAAIVRSVTQMAAAR